MKPNNGYLLCSCYNMRFSNLFILSYKPIVIIYLFYLRDINSLQNYNLFIYSYISVYLQTIFLIFATII